MDAIGIDSGSYKTVLATVKQRGIEIVLSETSNKSTPTLAAYTPEERIIGDAASNQMKKNFKNTLQFFSRFLGLNADCVEQLAEEKKFTTYKIIELENKQIGFEVVCRGEKHILSPMQVFAFFLRKSKTYFENAGIQSKEMVLSIPTYATNVERQAYLDAAEIAGIKCIKLLNESTAIALNYGFFRKGDLSADVPRIVAFVDFGHSKLTVTFASFLQSKTKIIYTFSDRNLGARQIDYQLFDLIGADFEKKHGCDPRQNVRARLRLLDSIEKMRKLLTLNKEAELNCDSLMEDIDFCKVYSREDLEKVTAPFFEKFKNVVKQALQQSGITIEKIDNVELVGDSTRMPVIIESLKEVFGKEELSRTLNSQECIARGCALQAAMLSPNFQVAQFEVEEYNQNSVEIKYKFKNSDKISQKELFKVGGSFPAVKSVTFENKLGGLNLMIHYSDSTQILEGIPKDIAQYEISEAKLDEDKTLDKFWFTMRVSNNIHNIAQLEDVDFVQEWTEEEKIPVKASPVTVQKPAEEKKEGDVKQEGEQPKAEVIQPEQQFEIRKRNKKSQKQIKFSTRSFALAPQERKKLYDLEQEFVDGDFSILEAKALKNTLEAYSYDMRTKIDQGGELEKYIEPETRNKFLQEINFVVDWLYGDGENCAKEEYKKKITEFQQIGEPAKQRHFYYSELNVYLQQYEKQTHTILNKLQKIAHLTEEQRQQVIKEQDEAKTFFGQVTADRDSKQLYENTAFKVEQIQATLSHLKSKTESIFNAPPPKVEEPAASQQKPAQEQQPRDPSAAEKNEEMKDEGNAV